MTDKTQESNVDGDVQKKKTSVLSSIITNPQVMGAFNDKLQTMVGRKSDFIPFLPKNVKRRLKALKRLQLDIFKIEADFFKEMHVLESKFSGLYKPLNDKRKDIITAMYEPTDEECEFEDEEEEEEDEKKDKNEKKESVFPGDTKGIPEFWFTILKNVPNTNQLIFDADEDVLKCLTDIRVEHLTNPDQMGYKLHFDFSPNDYFTQSTLTKTYNLRMLPDEKCPMNYDGPEIVTCSGCEISWKEGKDLTKDQNGVKKESFFNFFSPPSLKDKESDQEEVEDELSIDFETGHMLQSMVVPKAVLYYTGEALDDEDDYSEEGDDFSEGDDDDDDPDYKPSKKDKNECKQQ